MIMSFVIKDTPLFPSHLLTASLFVSHMTMNKLTLLFGGGGMKTHPSTCGQTFHTWLLCPCLCLENSFAPVTGCHGYGSPCRQKTRGGLKAAILGTAGPGCCPLSCSQSHWFREGGYCVWIRASYVSAHYTGVGWGV